MDGSLPRILIVDDEPLVRNGLARILRGAATVHLAASAGDARALLATQAFDAVVTDENMPGERGASLLAYVRDAHPTCGRILISAIDVPSLHDGEATWQVFLAKPFTAAQLQAALASVTKKP